MNRYFSGPSRGRHTNNRGRTRLTASQLYFLDRLSNKPVANWRSHGLVTRMLDAGFVMKAKGLYFITDTGLAILNTVKQRIERNSTREVVLHTHETTS